METTTMGPSPQVPRRNNGLAMMMSIQLREKQITSSPRWYLKKFNLSDKQLLGIWRSCRLDSGPGWLQQPVLPGPVSAAQHHQWEAERCGRSREGVWQTSPACHSSSEQAGDNHIRWRVLRRRLEGSPVFWTKAIIYHWENDYYTENNNDKDNYNNRKWCEAMCRGFLLWISQRLSEILFLWQWKTHPSSL